MHRMSHADQRSTALLALFLSFGLAINVFASNEVAKTQAEIATTSAETVPAPIFSPSPQPVQQPAPMPPVEIDFNGDTPPHQPPLSKQEVSGFVQDMKNVVREAKQVLKDLKSAAASATVEGWRTILNTVVKSATDCVGTVEKTKNNDDKRDAMNECRSANYFQEINEIRQSFVPPQEIKNALNDMKSQEKELARFARQLAKTGGATLEMVKKLQNEIASYRSNLTNAAGQDQRDALQEWWDARFWESVNNVRAYAEIPKQLSGAKKDLARAEKQLAKETFKKAAAFLSLDRMALTSGIAEKKKAFDEIDAALASGDGESANELMQDNVYQSWHPGDLMGIIDMSSNVYRMVKNVRDAELKEQLLGVMEPITDAINDGDYRDANQAMNQVQAQIQQYERYFREPTNSRFSSKMFKAFDALEQTFRKKFDEQDASAPVPERE